MSWSVWQDSRTRNVSFKGWKKACLQMNQSLNFMAAIRWRRSKTSKTSQSKHERQGFSYSGVGNLYWISCTLNNVCEQHRLIHYGSCCLLGQQLHVHKQNWQHRFLLNNPQTSTHLIWEEGHVQTWDIRHTWMCWCRGANTSPQTVLNVESVPDNVQAVTEANWQTTSSVKTAHISRAVLKMRS